MRPLRPLSSSAHGVSWPPQGVRDLLGNPRGERVGNIPSPGTLWGFLPPCEVFGTSSSMLWCSLFFRKEGVPGWDSWLRCLPFGEVRCTSTVTFSSREASGSQQN